MNDSETTHFGYQTVGVDEKANRVASVFHSVADRYDLMNDLMSMGMHRLWKRFAIDVCGLRPGMKLLDLAGGTADMTRLAYRAVGETGSIVVADINASMLQVGRDRLVDAGMVPRARCVQVDAECLPFPAGTFDCVVMAFGLRNVTDKDRALRSINRVLRRGGRLVVLEFSTVRFAPLAPLYDWYSFRMLPALGKRVAGDADSYQYLAESIRMHPDQETLRTMMSDAGFGRCSVLNLSGGIVAVHRGYRLD